MAKRFPIHPSHPERNCWGCDRYCASDAMLCGNGSERTQHPVETVGPGWEAWDGAVPEGAKSAAESAEVSMADGLTSEPTGELASPPTSL